MLTARRLGHGGVDQHIDQHLSGIAVPLSDRKGECIGALSMTIQTRSYRDNRHVTKLLPALQEAAQALRAIV